eukprot:643201_1
MFEKGDTVELSGLKSKPEWNGKTATITSSFNWDKGRYPMCVIINDSSNEALLKPSNMKLKSKHNPNKEPLFELIVTKDKGIGMIARCDIQSGSTIFTDTPLLHIPRNRSKDDTTKQKHILEQFKSLSEDEQQMMLNYHIQIDTNESKSNDEQNANDKDVLGIYFTNAFTIINQESLIESGFFPNIARMNHSCLSNCEVLSYDIDSNSRSVIALFDVQKGSELSINYIGNTYYTLCMEQKVRKEYIVSNFNFVCMCRCCVQYDKKREQYRSKYGELQECIDQNVNQFNKKAFKRVLSCSQQMIQIIKDGFNAYPTILSQCYINAAHALLFLNEYEASLKYLKQSVEMDQKYYGHRAMFDDVEECLSKIPKKYHQQYPWHHVLNLE